MSDSWLVSPHVSPWYRNINRFPFPQTRLAFGLGSTNCQMIDIAGKPWPLRRLGISPSYAATPVRIFIPQRSTGSHDPASVHWGRLPTTSFEVQGLGNRLSAFHFQGLNPRWVNCYVLFKGWLFLSLPSHCLRVQTPFTV